MIRDIKDMTSFKWATVRGTGPLQIQLDGDADPLALIPDSLVDPTLLKVGDRVRVELSLRKVVIHGKSSGYPLPDFPDTVILWQGSPVFMQDGQSVTLSQKVSEQRRGIVLVWSNYASGSAVDSNFAYCFVPKEHVAFFASGTGVNMLMSNAANPPVMMSKYVYVSDQVISGNNINSTAPANSRVLRAVLGV